MSRQLNDLLPGQSWLSALVICFAFTAACGGASDATDEEGTGSSFGGSVSGAAAAGRPAVAAAGGGSVAGGGQFAGSGGSGNSAGAGGNLQFAGAGSQLGGSGGTIATGAAGGGSGGVRSGSGGARSGSGGAKSGSGGSAGHAGQSTGGSGGMAPTWTEIYTKFIANAQYSSNCNGAACHNPGKEKGYDFSTQANGYASVKSKTSQFVSVLSNGSMPRGKTKMPTTDLAIIKAWVAAGALNN